jgi:hypothetical protein
MVVLVTIHLGFFLFNLFTDIGYGNYLLTAPVERNKRQFWKADSEIPVEMEKIDVSDLLSLANTLTNPLAPAKKKKDKTELWEERAKKNAIKFSLLPLD